MEKYYILDGKTAKSVDLITWVTWIKKADRHVADERIGGSRILTTFLGFDHSFFPNEPPLLFKTEVFDGPLNGEVDRHTTWEQAEKGHAATVRRVAEIVGYNKTKETLSAEFNGWLKKRYPEIRLLDWQIKAVNIVLNQPMAAGKTFLIKIIDEYDREASQQDVPKTRTSVPIVPKGG